MQRKSIYNEFIKENNIKDSNDNEKNQELLDNIKKSKIILSNMYDNLQFAEGDLIDYFTYQIKAEEAKYDFLIKQAKKNEINEE